MILIVEDEASIADTILFAAQTENIDCHWVTTGSDALKALEDLAPNLIVMDVGLPDTTGFELCKVIRRTSEVPIIFLTARSEEIDRILGLEIGGDDYVTKPFSPRELMARIRAVLKRLTPVPAKQTSDDKFVLDIERNRIMFRNHPLKLTRTEHLILTTLLERPGVVFSRDQLIDAAWNDSLSSFDRAVDTHIKSIRNKLRTIDPDDQSIKTHRGFGYSVE